MKQSSGRMPVKKKWPKYTAPEIQNDIISIMANIVWEEICLEINESKWFAIMADESQDVSKNEQLSIAVRYVHNGAIHKEFLN